MFKRELFTPETATHEEDLPHRFQESVGSAFACEVCGCASDEPRHAAWEKAQLVERERAAGTGGFTREFGS